MTRPAPMPAHHRRLTSLVATAVALCLAVTGLTMQSAQAADTGSITGQVFTRAVGANQVPADDVFIYLYRADTVDGEYDMVDGNPDTDSRGFSFPGSTVTFPGLSAGFYKFEVAGVGADGYQREYYNDAATLSGARPIQVGTGVVSLDDMVVEPAGQISGKVTDRQGNPLEGASVMFEKTAQGGGDGATTDENGNFTSKRTDVDLGTGLVRGDYRVSARLSGYTNPDAPSYEQRYWQNSATYAGATPVSVTPGGTTGQVNIVLDVAPRVRLTVKDPEGNPLANADVGIWVFYDGSWTPFQGGPHRTDDDGIYRRTMRIGDRFKFFVTPPAGVGGVTEWYDNAYSEATATEVTATEYGQVRDIEIQLGDAPVVTGTTPTIAGTPVVGQELTATPGAWGPTGVDVTYEWFADDTKISGATTNTYRLTTNETGKTITVKATGTLADHTPTTLESTPTATVTLPLVTGTRPIISGEAEVGQNLTAAPGAWGPTGVDLAYQWFAGDTPVGIDADSYTPTATDIGKAITVEVTGTLADHTPTTLESAPTTEVVAAPVVIVGSVPKITGTARAGTSLIAAPGTWSPSTAKLTYRWFAGGKQIPGATARWFTPSNAQAGKTIAVAVTGSLPGSASVTRWSSSTRPVLGLMSASKVSISGTAKVGKTLRARTRDWAPKPVRLTYRWYRNGKAISGQARSTYKLRTADAGRRITVRVTQSKSGYVSVNKLSAKTAKVKKK